MAIYCFDMILFGFHLEISLLRSSSGHGTDLTYRSGSFANAEVGPWKLGKQWWRSVSCRPKTQLQVPSDVTYMKDYP